MRAYNMTLTMLSPVHIGTGEEIAPHEYVVHKDAKGGLLFDAIDYPRFIADLDGRTRVQFNQAIDRGLPSLRQFTAEHYNSTRHCRWWATANERLLDLYNAGLRDDSSQLLVQTMTRDGHTGNAYLPGSSIKGALRTAWVSFKAQSYRGRENLETMRSDRDFEPEVLGYRTDRRTELRADPFRALHVGDAQLTEAGNTVDPVVIHRRPGQGGASDPSGIQMYFDATFSKLDGEEITASGRLNLRDELSKTDGPGAPKWKFRNCVADSIDIDELLNACNNFYGPKLQEEQRTFYRGNEDLESAGATLRELTSNMADNEALIRLGRFSHFECVTVDRYRRSPRKGYGSSRSLFDGVYPFGWVKLALTPINGNS